MAVTKGQGNPSWTRDETILALDLYYRIGGKVSGSSSEEISALSNLLRSLKVHSDKERQPSFRNVASVKFKLQNLHAAITGRGLTHISKVDAEVTRTFAGDINRIKNVADAILHAADEFEPAKGVWKDQYDGALFPEGAILTVSHKRRERSSSLRRKFLERLTPEQLSCEICGFRKPKLPRRLQEAFFELHHLRPLAELNRKQVTKFEDVALLCACCHRAIHHLISRDDKWHSIESAKQAICSD